MAIGGRPSGVIRFKCIHTIYNCLFRLVKYEVTETLKCKQLMPRHELLYCEK